MSTSTKAETAPVPAISADQVQSYLRDHPNFLVEHTQLLATLTPPTLKTGRDVLDMQRFMIERLRGEIESLRQNRRDLMHASQLNMQSQERVHKAVLRLLDARTFEHLLEIVTVDFVDLLDVDVATLCFETPDVPMDGLKARGVHTINPGTVKHLMGDASGIVLRDKTGGDTSLFGDNAARIQSDALIRLRVTKAAPPGLLALGSHTKERFHPDQGTDLLKLLADALARCIRAWLDLPN